MIYFGVLVQAMPLAAIIWAMQWVIYSSHCAYNNLHGIDKMTLRAHELTAIRNSWTQFFCWLIFITVAPISIHIEIVIIVIITVIVIVIVAAFSFYTSSLFNDCDALYMFHYTLYYIVLTRTFQHGYWWPGPICCQGISVYQECLP